ALRPINLQRYEVSIRSCTVQRWFDKSGGLCPLDCDRAGSKRRWNYSVTATEKESEMVEMKRSDLRSNAQRIADRLKPSNETSTPNTVTKHGDGPTRTVTTVHHSGHQHQHGPVDPGMGDITGAKRGSVHE